MALFLSRSPWSCLCFVVNVRRFSPKLLAESTVKSKIKPRLSPVTVVVPANIDIPRDLWPVQKCRYVHVRYARPNSVNGPRVSFTSKKPPRQKYAVSSGRLTMSRLSAARQPVTSDRTRPTVPFSKNQPMGGGEIEIGRPVA